MITDVYYRPKWTCGKYNAKKRVAIMFNLLTYGEYFFEEESAEVIGMILQAGHNGRISITNISKVLDISIESIYPFFVSLLDIGLLSREYPSEDYISSYRNLCKSLPQEEYTIGEKKDFFHQCDISTVELAYENAVADCTEITSATFELTYRCSEKCLHCYNPGATRNNSEVSGRGDLIELKFNDYTRIIDEMCAEGLVTVTLTGGDPFACEYIWDLLEYLYKKDIAVTILTNGQQLVHKTHKLATLFPRSVRLSLYAADANAHDNITRKYRSWQTTIDVITNLKNESVPVVINSILMRPGLKSYLKLKEIGEQLSCPILFDYSVVDSIDGDVCPTQHLRLTSKELELVLMDEEIEPKTKDFDIFSNPAPASGAPCRAGRGVFCVTPDGKLIPCVSMHMILGDLIKQDFHSILKDNKQLNNLLKSKKSDYIECGTHDYCKCCIFCAGNSYTEHNYPFQANENNCYVAKNRFSLMEKLKSGVDILNGKTLKENIEMLPDYQFPSMSRIKGK